MTATAPASARPGPVQPAPSPQPATVRTVTVADISLYIEAADQATLRRTLRAVLDHLDTLTTIAAASAAIGHGPGSADAACAGSPAPRRGTTPENLT